MNKKLLDLIRKKFTEALSKKTSWGRNDLMAVYDQCVSEAALELLSDQS